jgi:acyl-homoserine lactone acylase PvdQ
MSTETNYPPPMPGGGYALRGVVVAEQLDELQGPLEGQVRLPHHLDWSPAMIYELGDQASRELLYRVVLMEAASVEDLRTWLDCDELVRLWPQLYLPRVVRAASEERHEILRKRGAGPHVPEP